LLPDLLLSILLGAVTLALIGCLGLAFQLTTQYGRLLIRLETLESATAAKGAERKRLPSERPLAESRLERHGLKAGTRAPLFDLPGIDGSTVSLKTFQGRRVLLVFSDPRCGPCDQLAPHLARLHREHEGNGLAVVMVGRGEPKDNREKAGLHNLQFPIALQRRWELSTEYGIFATPVAFLIDENGLIARNVAVGKDEILELLQGRAME
jgi:peroxiredoxin